MRLKSRFMISEKVFTVRVFASPGTPSIRTCPPAIKAVMISVTSFSCPTSLFDASFVIFSIAFLQSSNVFINE